MTEESIRPDGRQIKQLRDLHVEVGNLSRADGSAKVRLGKNMAIASVFGPREQHPKFLAKSDRATVRINYRMATFSVNDYKKSFPSRREKEISKVLSEAFESVVITKHFPRSAIDVHVQLFESDGGTRTAAAIAVSAALADAGIPMRDLIGGIASGIYQDEVCLDLCGQEDMKGTGDMPILYAPELDEVSLFQLDGKFTFDQFKDAFYTSIEAIKYIVKVIQDALRMKYLNIKEEADVDEEDDQDDIQTFIQDEFISASGEDSEEDEESGGDPEVETVDEPVEEDVTPPFPSRIASSFDPDDDPLDEETDSTEEISEVVDIPAPKAESTDEEKVEAEIVTEEPSTTMEVTEPTKDDATEEPTPETEKNEETQVQSNENSAWYDQALGLKPMGGKPKHEDDVMRDIEYSFEEDQ
ncbi:MAG: exosome complex exonuclease Rrp41 [Candidatus Heimdallarchaeota archaeon]|nr:exosome complex exonuclease Rrp41 [Candidatus Heimdallarchaeota archaeon]